MLYACVHVVTFPNQRLQSRWSVSETQLCACVFLHSNPFTLAILRCSTLFGRSWRLFCSFASKKAVLTANTLQISELFSHFQCALKRVILQVKLRYTNYCSHLKHTLNYILLTVVQYIHCGLYTCTKIDCTLNFVLVTVGQYTLFLPT